MKRRLSLLTVALFAVLLAGLPSCSKDSSMQGQIDQRNRELDKLEARDQEIRDLLLKRIADLREKLEKLIDEVEESLNKRIEEGENSVMKKAARDFGDLAGRIDAGFADLHNYIDGKMSDCNRYLNSTFSTLDAAKDKVREKALQASADGDYRLNALLKTYEADVDRVILKGRQAESAVKGLEADLAKAESLRDLLNGGQEQIEKLDKAYAEMEEAQLKLMQAVAARTTDVSSLEAIQDEYLRGQLMKASALLDDMEEVKERVQASLDESGDLFSAMEDLLSYIDGDIINGVGAAIGQMEGTYQDALDILDWFESLDPTEYQALIDEANAEMFQSFEELKEEIENARGIISSEMQKVTDDYDYIKGQYDEVQSFVDEAQYQYMLLPFA